MSEDDRAPPRRSRKTLWLILALCAAPLAASYIAYYFLPPATHVNYGELLEPRPLPDVEVTSLDGSRMRLSALKGEWVLLIADDAACNEYCRTKLVYARQVRLAAGREQGRIERVWLVTDRGVPDAALLAEHPGLGVMHEPTGMLLKALPAAGSPVDHVYVIDPLGNLMLRFPRDPDPRKMLRDMSRLLRHSKWK